MRVEPCLARISRRSTAADMMGRLIGKEGGDIAIVTGL